MKVFKVNQDGVDFVLSQTGLVVEEGAEVEFELSKDQETALVAAGWLEPTKKKAKGD